MPTRWPAASRRSAASTRPRPSSTSRRSSRRRTAGRAAGRSAGAARGRPAAPRGGGPTLAQARTEHLAAGAPPILLGRELARSLGVFPGDSVTVISPEGAVTAVGMVPKMRRYLVAGTIEIGMHEYDSSIAYLSLPQAKEFAGLVGVSGIE